MTTGRGEMGAEFLNLLTSCVNRGDSLLAFYQTNGSDVTEFVRDFERGQWTSSLVPIPDG